MRSILAALILLLTCAPLISAQEDSETRPPRAIVRFESVYVRLAPALDAEVSASVFQDNVLEIVGRNLDGQWFEVRRPGRFNNLGWVFTETLDWDFAPETLPLTDTATGLAGPIPLSEDPGFADYVIENVIMRSLPYFQGERLPTVPAGSTVPVLARDASGEWLRVNYIGHEGWIIGYTTRPLAAVMEIPIAPGLPPIPAASNVLIIPPELQLAQVQRMRDFVLPLRDYADGVANFWFLVNQGEIMPCNPPAFINEYRYGNQDIRELPELQRFAPRTNEAVQLLNDSIRPLENCGLIDQRTVRDVRNKAINARVIFNATLGTLDNLEQNVIR